MLANNSALARRNMVLQQIRPCEVIDERVLSVIECLPREEFVPEDYRGLSFADIEIPIGEGQRMMKPLIEAQMMQSLAIVHTDHILEIGTGTGFITACLDRLGGKVDSWEIREKFSKQAAQRLETQGLRDVGFHVGDALNSELPDAAFDVIAVTGSLPKYDERLEKLLAMQGRLYVVVGESPVMEVMLITRIGEDLFRREVLSETDLQPLENAMETEPFVF